MSYRQKIFIESTPLINTHISGVGQVLLETVKALDDDRFIDTHDIRLFVPINELSKMNKYNFKNIKVISIPIPHKFFSLFSRLKYAVPLDLLLGKGVYIFPNFRNWNLLFSKSLTYIHDVCFAIYPQYVQPKNLQYLKKYIQLWIKRTDRVLTISQASKDEIVERLGVANDKVSIILNTVNTHFYKKQPHEAVEKIKKKYSLDNYLLFIGNIEPRKNLENLIKAFKEAEITQPTTLFIVGGDGWLNENVYSQIEEARKLGLDVRKNKSYVPDDDLPALISGANALILPSWHEGYGLPAVQAIACETVAICADIPSLRELSVTYGDSMELFKPDDTKALGVLLNKYADQGSKSIKTVHVSRDWADVVNDLIAESVSVRSSL